MESHEATSDEEKQVLLFVKENEPEWYKDALDEIPRLINDRLSELYIWKENKKVIGIMGYLRRHWGADDVFWGEWLLVDKSERQRGIGKKIYFDLENRIKEIGGRKIYVDIDSSTSNQNIKAYKFHIGNGYAYEATLKDFWGDGQDFVLLSKRLK